MGDSRAGFSPPAAKIASVTAADRCWSDSWEGVPETGMVRSWRRGARVVMRRWGRPNDYIWWVSHNYFVAHVPMMVA